VFGGGLSLRVGAYSYSQGSSGSASALGAINVIGAPIHVHNTTFTKCFAVSFNNGISYSASAYGGALSLSYDANVYPFNPTGAVAISVCNSNMRLSHCVFRSCGIMTSSVSCASGTSNAAGGSLFNSIASINVNISFTSFFNTSAVVSCAAFSQNTYSLGGGVSIFNASSVSFMSCNFIGCRAQGVPQATNVFVSGGGIHVQAADSVILQKCIIIACSVVDAFSTFLQSGGGALGIRNVPNVCILNSNILNNSDASMTGSIFLQQSTPQLQSFSDMSVEIFDSIISTAPSSVPALNVSCGSKCPKEQQQHLRISFKDSNVSAEFPPENQFDLSAVLSLPLWSPVQSSASFLNCNFTGKSALAIIALVEHQSAQYTCTPCSSPFEIASTSSTLDMKNLNTIIGKQCTAVSNSSSQQQCPYGIHFCSTIVNVTVGFWAQFGADGNISNAIRCPSNYCGCRNIPAYTNPTCQIFPFFSPNFLPDDALCNSNRRGVLCGGCKINFAQSLNGYSRVSNDICASNIIWIWTVTFLGYLLYSIYIVVSSLQADDGLIMCFLFYGQISSFAGSVVVSDQTEATSSSSWFSVTQFASILNLYQNSCYGLNMGAYAATAAQLIGPAIVLLVSLLLTLTAKRLKPRLAGFLEKHELKIRVSFGVTLTNVLQLLFSRVTDVVFKLITCQDIGDNGTKRVFIDGTNLCEGVQYSALMTVAVFLCILPLCFGAALRWKLLPTKVRTVVCCAYTDSKYYWGTVTLLFRMIMTILNTTIHGLPSVSALALSFCTVGMLMLIMLLRPYAHLRTYYMDLVCYACLVVLFGLESLAQSSQSLGVSLGSTNQYSFIRKAADAINIIR